ncbi:MAG: ABC transporter permease [Pseudodesulfovibrio sp.]|uniref:Inner-membrane translocator n=1 Tax=Pseudodesulfovibrio aespoeensis (strain ATCC 700646 / DSM 10631 / Aspo-2) TaxID=643562 RepID=E6VVR4_PSEA9|nr:MULTISPECIES: ABC transporter permease [Pseudodesulfovibrio]MBU4191503.1 ABC transporter permease [Pseudomonadota bacterium]ADU61266.1 inner-membrane translocator [Pseudodesulfovibrio aespoeensis Aspo-2]MBU4243952.1 ABC transporter permease [Pseudomonadota bacterium]MBU4379116.1 ABC transporter permease [Pseudomonadota bacterium]MBU4476783.1 ABC transporter permease [Pseudomonadota bacterium]
MRLEARESVSLAMRALAPVIAVGAAMLVCSALLVWGGASPVQGWALLLQGALGSKFAISETLTRATPLILTGLAAAVAFRAKLWNIGGEGQFYMGAIVATWLGTGPFAMPAYLMIPSLFLAGAMGGGLLLLVPTLLKTRLQVDEVVTTLLLNFIVILFVNWLVFGPWKDPMAMGWPQAAPMVDEAMLPLILAKTRLHFGFFIALACAVGVWWFMRATTWGFEIRAVGASPRASAFAGMPVGAATVRTALLSGGLAAMAGVAELCGVKGYLTLDLSPGFGYSGIVVAMLAALHPLGVVASALFVAVVYIGADSMSRAINVSSYIADVTTAVCLLAVLVAMFLTKYRIRWR